MIITWGVEVDGATISCRVQTPGRDEGLCTAVEAMATAVGTYIGDHSDQPAGERRYSPAVDDLSPQLVEMLHDLGEEYGPLGVALAAARVSDPAAVLAGLREMVA